MPIHPHHSMIVDTDRDGVVLSFKCDAPEGSSCRMVPACVGPESKTGCYPEEDRPVIHMAGCEFYRDPEDDQVEVADMPHVDSGACWVSTWFEEHEHIVMSVNGSGTKVTVPVDIEWMGDYMGWSFAALPDVKAVLTKVRDTWQWGKWTTITEPVKNRDVLRAAQVVTNWLTAQIEKVH